MIRPILFSGDMVRAILDSRKTETRRPVNAGFEVEHRPANGDTVEHWMVRKPGDTVWANSVLFQPWNPGDLLWVREACWVFGTWRPTKNSDSGRFVPLGPVAYHADQQRPDDKLILFHEWRVTPSIHMPRWACRLVLEVVSVRVERLQDITEEGALMEGSFLGRCPCSEMRRKPRVPIEAAFRQTGCYIHGIEFKTLWDSIYSAKGRGWDANPWVWAVEFKVAAKTLNEAQAILGAA